MLINHLNSRCVKTFEPYVASTKMKYFVNISIFLHLWNPFMLGCITNFDFKELAIALFNYV
jgi:hypothetical protein